MLNLNRSPFIGSAFIGSRKLKKEISEYEAQPIPPPCPIRLAVLMKADKRNYRNYWYGTE